MRTATIRGAYRRTGADRNSGYVTPLGVSRPAVQR